ncbi:MAG: TolC family protein [bacterium]
MKFVKINIAALLLLAAFSGASAASTYGDMRNEARNHAPSFYKETLKNIGAEGPISPAPQVGSAEEAFEEAIGRVIDMGEKEKSKSVEDTAREFLTPKALKELSAIREAEKDDSLETFFAEVVNEDRFLAAAVEFSPAISAAGDNLRASINKYEQTVFLDQLLYQYLSFTESLDTRTASTKNKRMAQMSYPFPGMVSLKGDAVQKDVEIARVSYEEAALGVLAEVKIAYADLLYLDGALEITRENLGLARSIERVATELYGTGMAAYSDLVKISIRVDKLETMAGTYGRKKAAAETRLLRAAGLPAGIKPGELEEAALPEVPELKELRAVALKQRQELRRMELALERMDIMIDMAGRKLFPDYSLGLSYFQNREIASVGTQGVAPSFVVRPMESGAGPDFASENAYIREMRDRRSAMAGELENMRNDTIAGVDTYYARYVSASDTAETYRNSILIKAQNAYDASLSAYSAGGADFIDLLDAHRELLDQKLTFEEAERDARSGLAMLEKTVGGGPVSVKEGVSK